MKKKNVVSFIITYVILVLVIVVGSYIFYAPINQVIENNKNAESNYQIALNKVESLNTSQEIKDTYTNYNNEVMNSYKIVNKSLSNVLLLVLTALSLTLIILGFTLFYNIRKNKGIHVALIASGFTTILFTIWFIYQSINNIT